MEYGKTKDKFKTDEMDKVLNLNSPTTELKSKATI